MGNFSSGQPAIYQIDQFFQHEIQQHHLQKKIHQEQMYRGFETPEGNIVWTGVSSLSYYEFKKHFLHAHTLSFKQKNKQADKILNSLGHAAISKTDISECQTYVKNDSQTLHIYNSRIHKKFPSQKSHQFKQKYVPNEIIVYGCLIKDFLLESSFNHPIQWFGKSIQENENSQKGSHLVQAFGFYDTQTLNEIKIIEYKDSNNYFIGFEVRQEISNQCQKQKKQIDDIIYLLSDEKESNKRQTVSSIINKVMKADRQISIERRQNNKKLNKFAMPVIKLEIQHEYNDFQKLEIKNQQFQGKRLKLIENAQIQIKGNAQIKKQAIQENQQSSLNKIELIIDKPFWLVLTKPGRHPYFVQKINWLPERRS